MSIIFYFYLNFFVTFKGFVFLEQYSLKNAINSVEVIISSRIVEERDCRYMG